MQTLTAEAKLFQTFNSSFRAFVENQKNRKGSISLSAAFLIHLEMFEEEEDDDDNQANYNLSKQKIIREKGHGSN